MPPMGKSVDIHLYSSSRKPELFPKACQLTASFVKRSYKIVGQVATMTNSLFILQDYEGGLVHDFEGKVTMETYTELRKATDFSVAMITCAAGMLGKLWSRPLNHWFLATPVTRCQPTMLLPPSPAEAIIWASAPPAHPALGKGPSRWRWASLPRAHLTSADSLTLSKHHGKNFHIQEQLSSRCNLFFWSNLTCFCRINSVQGWLYLFTRIWSNSMYLAQLT